MLQRLQKSFHSSLLNCTILLARARWHPTTLTTFPLTRQAGMLITALVKTDRIPTAYDLYNCILRRYMQVEP